MRLNEYSKYRANRERAEAILRLLEGEPDKTMKDEHGSLTHKISKLLPRHLRVNRQGKEAGHYVITSEMARMEEAGWLCRDVYGRRTYSVILVDYPEDWVKPEVKENVEAVYTGPELAESNIKMVEQLEFEQVPEPAPVPRVSITTSQLRTLIHNEVLVAMDDWFRRLALGFYERKAGE